MTASAIEDRDDFAEAIRRIRSGDAQAAADFVRRYEPLIRREVRMQLDDPRLMQLFDSTDVCQSVLASFFLRTAAGQFDLASPIQVVRLLTTMVRNKLASAHRRHYRERRDVRQQRGLTPGEFEQVADNRPGPADDVSHRELLERIKARMTPEELQIAHLRTEGAAWSEIAEQLGGTAKSRRMQLTRAIDRITLDLDVD